MRILITQSNPTLGDLKKNIQSIKEAISLGKQVKADLVVFPEMALTGYPPEDLLFIPHFMKNVEEGLYDIVKNTEGISVLLGLPRKCMENRLYNSCALIHDKKIIGFADKILLPTYDVFDERRYFEPGDEVKIWAFGDERVGITICEDIWQHSGCLEASYYDRDPIQELQKHRPTLVINMSASPYNNGKYAIRLKVSQKVSETLQCPVIFCNQVGGNDSLLFDGRSYVLDNEQLIQQAKAFEEDTLLIDTNRLTQKPVRLMPSVEETYHALVMGVRDYFRKTGHNKACLGLSGGVDSAVVACIAKEALGSSSVMSLMMPSRYTSQESLRDAQQLANRLEISYREKSIEPFFDTLIEGLGAIQSITEENIQSRIRGMLLMAYCNETQSLLLNTGNKSELAMGYCTLYGDMCGALSVLGDVVKGKVYELAHFINKDREVIPAYILERPPSAELKAGQKDSDSLPEYPILDAVLTAYIEEGLDAHTISREKNISIECVSEIIKRIHANEYKRRQSPLALRVSPKAFCVGRKVPIT